MENIELIVSLASAAGSLLIACAAFVIKLIKNIKAKIKAEGKLQLSGILGSLIETAESMDDLTGEEKLGFVLDSASSYASAHEIDFDEYATAETVEQLIELTKHVN